MNELQGPEFGELFHALSGHAPFPWQERLYARFIGDGDDNIPASCNIPTSLGKTAVVAIWLIALANRPSKMPRRLVYVVNRRTVVDQTTNEVENLRKRLKIPDEFPQHSELLRQLRNALGRLWSNNDEVPLAISTLRGQFADNQEWSADPSRPAVICGTVDMIGSRLLFSGYHSGFKSRPLHAGFLGQDALLVHDEAHLEPAFQSLLLGIEEEQKRCNDFRPLRVIELTATSRANDPEPLGLSEDDLANKVVRKRIEAKKAIQLHANEDKKKLADDIAQLALNHEDSGSAVLVYVRTVYDVEKVTKKLPKESFEQLTGTLRGLERDDLVKRPIFQRFLPESNRDEGVTPVEGTVYLVCTSAGEVGIDISADHMVCDLSTFESMAQRFGRVNRYGERTDTRIDVVYPTKFDDKETLREAREATLQLLQDLKGDASPAALGELLYSLTDDERKAAFTPEPTIPKATDILFDAWALTSIREKLPGRPPVEPYLHGVSEWQPPETYVAWREEVGIITGDLRDRYKPEDLLEDYQLKPHEFLRDRSERVFEKLQVLACRHPDESVWVMDEQGSVLPCTLGALADPSATKASDKRRLIARIEGCTVLLPPFVGGLSSSGMLDGTSTEADDVADEWYEDKERTTKRRIRLWDDEVPPPGMRVVRPPIDTRPEADESDSDESAGQRFWHWYTRPRSADDDLSRTSTTPIALDQHTCAVVQRAQRIADVLLKDHADLGAALVLAARLHDLGKRREIWQRSIGNPNPANWHAKSGKDPSTGTKWVPRDICPDYRHEFGSLLDALDVKQEHRSELNKFSIELKDFVLHVIAAHHGRARPHFPTYEAYDTGPGTTQVDADHLACEVPQRFARLQRKYGRWGLAYLESLLRAADWAASADPSAYADEPESQP